MEAEVPQSLPVPAYYPDPAPGVPPYAGNSTHALPYAGNSTQIPPYAGNSTQVPPYAGNSTWVVGYSGPNVQGFTQNQTVPVPVPVPQLSIGNPAAVQPSFVPPAAGVSNCYVFKSRLQEYTQKLGISTPVYETTKEGPSHEPTFRSSVTVNNVRYDSLPGFYNRKAAEQSAAEVAFLAIMQSGDVSNFVPHPVHETGLCKNLLQEYAQKMSYAIPFYTTVKHGLPGQLSFTCTVEIGGMQYIGASAKTKKEAEIKAARTALWAIQSSTSGNEMNQQAGSVYNVLPGKKKGRELEERNGGVKPLKAKKARFKKGLKKKFQQIWGDKSKSDQDNNVNKEDASGFQPQDPAIYPGVTEPITQPIPQG